MIDVFSDCLTLIVEIIETVSTGDINEEGITVSSTSDSFVGVNKGASIADLSTPYNCTSSSSVS